MNSERYTAILVPDEPESSVAVLVPAMPGCVTQGHSREAALANAREAMASWLEVEASFGRGPLPETPSLVLTGVAEALQIIDDMRAAGERSRDAGYYLEVVQVVPQAQPVAA